MKNINSISGYYGGVTRKIDGKVDATLVLEGFSVKRSGKLNYNLEQDPSKANYELRHLDTDLDRNLSVNRIVATLSYDVSDHYSLAPAVDII